MVKNVTIPLNPGLIPLEIPLNVSQLQAPSILNFSGFINWTVVVDNQTTYYVTPFSFSLPYYGEVYFSVHPLENSLTAGENVVTFVINKSKVPIYYLRVWVNSESLNLTPQAEEFNASIFVPLQFYSFTYPVEVRAYYLTPYGFGNFSQTYYLLVREIKGTPLSYEVISSPNPSSLTAGKNVLEVNVTNVLGTTLHDVYVELLINNGSAMKYLTYLPQWRPNQSLTYSQVVYAFGGVEVEAYVFNDSGNITELGKVDIPITENLTAMSFLYNFSNSRLTLFNNLPIEMENVSVNGYLVGNISPRSFVALKEIPSLLNVTYYVDGVEFEKVVELEPQALSVNYSFLDREIALSLKNELWLELSNVVLTLTPTLNSFNVGQIAPYAQVTFTIDNASSAAPIEITYFVNNVEYFLKYEPKVVVTSEEVPILKIEGYQVIQNGNTFSLVFDVKNLGNATSQAGYLLVSSNLVSSIYPEVVSLPPLAPGQTALAYVYVTSNVYKFNVTATLVWSNGYTVFNKSYTVVVVNKYPVVKYLSVAISFLGYSVFGLPLIFIIVVIIIAVIVLMPRRRKKSQ